MHGWLPVSVQIVTTGVLLAAVTRRNRRWRRVWLPWAVLSGVALAVAAYWYLRGAGIADDGNPAPRTFWVWIALSGASFGVLVVGWRKAPWWRRGAAALAVPLCVLSTALVLNLWVGYFPTAQTAWEQLTAGPVPDQTDQVTVAAMHQQHRMPRKGSAPHCPGSPVRSAPPRCPESACPARSAGSLSAMPDVPSTEPEPGYTPDGVPTFDSVREKIETRYGTAIGSAELAAETPEGRAVEEQYDARQRAAAERLAQIRKSMTDDDQ